MLILQGKFLALSSYSTSNNSFENIPFRLPLAGVSNIIESVSSVIM